ATVQFLTASADNALTVPNAALRIKPTAEMLAQVGMGKSTTGGDSTQHRAAGDSTAHRWSGSGSNAGNGGSRAGAAGANGAGGANRASRPSAATIWYLDSAGTLHAERVRTGLTDGQKTQIEGKDLRAGMQVVTSVTSPDAATTPAAPASSGNPFQPQGGRGGRGF